MTTMFAALTLVNRRGIACEPKLISTPAGDALASPCGLRVRHDFMVSAGDLSDAETGRLQGAHITAHYLDQCQSEYDTFGKLWAFELHIHEATGEILAANPVGVVEPW